MSSFLTPLCVDEKEDDSGAILAADFIYQSDCLGRLVTVPKGFDTDFASVPREVIAYGLFGGVAKWAAVIHDFLYRSGLVPRADADATFLEAMTLTGVAPWRRQAMYAAVRSFGWKWYKGKPTEEVEDEAQTQ